jgi:hypothetical protein
MVDRLKSARWRLVALALVVGVLACGLTVAALYVPAGPSELLVGRVEHVQDVPLGRYSSGQLVYVRVGSQTVATRGLKGACSVGDPILVRRQRMLLGSSLIAVACGSTGAVTVDQS